MCIFCNFSNSATPIGSEPTDNVQNSNFPAREHWRLLF
uniref:Uncharacterized protein n=1 Tax=Rhizophora mucronata TaxID=61149 RepID=A0A2P2JYV6_RHIMU